MMNAHLLTKRNQAVFHGLKLIQKKQLTKNAFSVEFEIPENLKSNFQFESGQYVSLKIPFQNEYKQVDYSITSAPYEGRITLGIKINSENSSSAIFYQQFQVGDFVEVSEPRGRFTLGTKPHEFRTIVGFCMGIGITPILSHFKNILYNEPRTRLFLFYGNSWHLKQPIKKIWICCNLNIATVCKCIILFSGKE
jgi:ring-1,2-phenylacetyl-CoA epoxidase subunit PaaE